MGVGSSNRKNQWQAHILVHELLVSWLQQSVCACAVGAKAQIQRQAAQQTAV